MRRIIVVGAVLLVTFAGVPRAAAETEEGIQVHGHWKIEIFEPDGTLVSVTEFENALGPMGDSFVSHALIGNYSVGAWLVKLHGPPAGTGPCDDGGGGDRYCGLLEAGTAWSGPFNSSDLVVEWSGAMVLSGSVTADFSTSINQVDTVGKACASNVDPDSCGAMTTGTVTNDFTMAVLGSPPSVSAGQVIQVTVTISFS